MDLIWYATFIYLRIRYHGDPQVWWTKEWPFYTKPCNTRQGAQNFWKRIRVKEEDGETICLPKRIKQEEKKIIDLTYNKDVEVIDLTKGKD